MNVYEKLQNLEANNRFLTGEVKRLSRENTNLERTNRKLFNKLADSDYKLEQLTNKIKKEKKGLKF